MAAVAAVAVAVVVAAFAVVDSVVVFVVSVVWTEVALVSLVVAVVVVVAVLVAAVVVDAVLDYGHNLMVTVADWSRHQSQIPASVSDRLICPRPQMRGEIEGQDRLPLPLRFLHLLPPPLLLPPPADSVDSLPLGRSKELGSDSSMSRDEDIPMGLLPATTLLLWTLGSLLLAVAAAVAVVVADAVVVVVPFLAALVVAEVAILPAVVFAFFGTV